MLFTMPSTKLSDFEHINKGLHRGRMSSGDHAYVVSTINRTLGNKIYADALNRGLSIINIV